MERATDLSRLLHRLKIGCLPEQCGPGVHLTEAMELDEAGVRITGVRVLDKSPVAAARAAMVKREDDKRWGDARVRWSVELAIDSRRQFIIGDGDTPELALADLIRGAQDRS